MLNDHLTMLSFGTARTSSLRFCLVLIMNILEAGDFDLIK